MARKRSMTSKAQAKHGHDIGRSIWYREDFKQPWPQIAKTITPLKRWALRKRHSYPISYSRLKAIEQHGQTLSPYPD